MCIKSVNAQNGGLVAGANSCTERAAVFLKKNYTNTLIIIYIIKKIKNKYAYFFLFKSFLIFILPLRIKV
jgi:hypothetical protein